MVKSKNIVFTEPVTRPNRPEELWEADSIWLYRDRPIRLYPSTDRVEETDDEHASSRLSKARLATLVDDVDRIANEPGTETIIRSPNEGLVILRRIRIGWLVACARPEASQFKVASELGRFSESVVSKFAGVEPPVDFGVEHRFGDEPTVLFRGSLDGDPDDVSWESLSQTLNEQMEGVSGRLKMFAVKHWRQRAEHVPLTLDLRDGFRNEVEGPLTVEQMRAFAHTYRSWREQLMNSVGELPDALKEDPEWFGSLEVKEVR